MPVRSKVPRPGARSVGPSPYLTRFAHPRLHTEGDPHDRSRAVRIDVREHAPDRAGDRRRPLRIHRGPYRTGFGRLRSLLPELVAIGAPTHAHTLPRASSREDAAKWASDPEQHLVLDPEASGPGVREWIDSLSAAPVAWAAFGTRVDIPRIFAGDASAGIERRLRRLDSRPVSDSECFLVTTKNALVDGELDRARAWGASLGEAAFAGQTSR